MATFLESLKKTLKNLNVRISANEKVNFARHLSVMAKAGMPMMQSLEMLQKQSRSRPMKKILGSIISDVNQGQFLSTALEKFSGIFGNLFVNIVRVGETAGILPENLNFLADELKKKQELKKKVVGAMIYPIVIIVATFGITGMLTVFIFPKIIPVFSSLNVELPFTTKIVIAGSNLLTQHGGKTVLALLGFLVLLWILLRIPIIRYGWTYFLMRVPVLGTLIRQVNLANFARTLGLTLKSEIQIVTALTVTAESLSNVVYRKKLLEVSEQVQKGESISTYLEKREFLFPPMLNQMVAVGENTGNLSETLLYMSDFYEGEVSNATKNLANVLEPILMVTMGIIVGFIAVSIITPIYQVSQTLTR